VIDTFIVVIPLMLSPGPANMVSLLLATRYSVKQLLPFLLGILLVYAIVAFTFGILAKHISDLSPIAINAMQIIGGLYIIYLGIQLARRKKPEVKERSPTLLSGITLQCLNPKFPGVVLAVFASRHSQPAFMTASVICIVGAFALLIYATVGSLLHAQHEPCRRLRIVDLGAGVMLCAVGLWFVFQASLGYLTLE
jgi:threonine/homoserine/homoserine lactone efflux protein